MELIKTVYPIAKKEHRCMLCGDTIKKGQRYERQTCTDGYMYDFICHDECSEVANKLELYDDCDNGLHEDEFLEAIRDYVCEMHTDDELDDISPEWVNLSDYESVCKILDELKTIDEQPRPDFQECTHFWDDINGCRLTCHKFCTLRGNNNHRCYHFKKKPQQ